MGPYKKCECGNMMEALDHDYDRAWYPEVCGECESRRNELIRAAGKLLAESDERLCFTFTAMAMKRIEYLRGEELKRLAGVRLN